MEKENYVVDQKGKKIAVQIPIKKYEKLLADSEELDEIREYRKAKSHKCDPIPFDDAFREIEESMK